MSGFDFLKGFRRDRRRHLTGPDLDTLNLLANVVEGRDPYTAGHTWRVSRYVGAMGRRLGWTKERVASIELGALFHDLGKISTEDHILNKTGKLTYEEFEKIKAHPGEGKRLLQGLEFLKPAVAGIYSHHEYYDGSGYPEGLKGVEIPMAGRIIAIADVFDALTSHRPYRQPIGSEKALAYLKAHKRTHFDPDLVDLFSSIWDKGIFEKTVLHSDGAIPLLACPKDGQTIALAKGHSKGDDAFCPVCQTRFVLAKNNGAWEVSLTG